MKLGVCAQVLHHLPFEAGLRAARDLGLETIELPLHEGNPWISLSEDDPAEVRRRVEAAGLQISAFSLHQESQLLLGPYGVDTAHIHPGDGPERAAWAASRLSAAATFAARAGVDVVIGFVGCEAWHRTFPWPLADGWDRGFALLKERLSPVLDHFSRVGARFAHECHPNQQIYDLETATRALEILGHHPAFAFNLDPANLYISDVDPVAFVVDLGTRVAHVHAKDGEVVRHRAGRSGRLAHGAWDRPDRGFRFRVPGWGDLDWRRLITELHLHGYTGTLAIEHEDPTLSRNEGLTQAIRHLGPLLLHEPAEPRWW